MPTVGTPERDLDAAGLLGTIACCAAWGGNAVAVKFAVPDLPPLACAGLRHLLALPILALIVLRARRPLGVAPRADLMGLVLLNALFTVAQIGTFNWGTAHSLAGRASIFINIHPLIVAPLGAWLLGERLGARAIAGLLAAALGVGLLLGQAFLAAGAGSRSSATGELVGDLVVILSGVLFGLQTVVQKLTFPRIGAVTLLFAQTVVAVPLFFVLSLASEGGPSRYHWTPGAVGGVMYQGIIATGFCYSLWFALLRRYPATRLATVVFLTPLFGIAFSRCFQGEPLRWPLLVAAAMVGLGIYLVASERSTPLSAPR